MLLAYVYPIVDIKCANIFLVENNLSSVIMSISNHVTAKGTFAFSRGCFDQIKVPFLKADVFLPHVRLQVADLFENVWQDIVKFYTIHSLTF